MRNHSYTPLFFLCTFFCIPFFAHAGQLTFVRDLINTSAPSVAASHEITFTVMHTIRGGGSVGVRFDGNGTPFVFPSGFDYTNVGFDVATTSGFVPYIVDSALDTATSTASLVSLGDGEVRVQIATGIDYYIPAGAKVRLRIGAGLNAGSVINPASEGSHRYTVTAYDEFGNEMDKAVGLVMIQVPVGLATMVEGKEVTIYNGLPFGLLPGGTKKVFVSAQTNVPAFCRYSLVPNIEYDNMPLTQRMNDVNFNLLHHFVVDVLDDHSYTYYLRCFSKYGLTANISDYPIKFDVGVIPKEHRLPPPPPGTQVGDNTGGGNSLPQSGLYISGRAFPNASVSILKDGVEFRTLSTDSQGNFSTQESGFDRGTYNFNITAIDSAGMRSAMYSTTLYLVASTLNNVGPIMLSPTITAKSPRIELGTKVDVSGLAIPLNVVQVVVLTSQDPMQQPLLVATTTADGSGKWSLTLATDTFRKDTYSLRAQSLIPGLGNSLFSNEFLLGVGEKPQGDLRKRADLNKDGKVNLADLSILLFNWKKSTPLADINSDGVVSIVDFSIMLSAWTG